ncbi:hypothetical protein [Flavobacterium okayamense]|uniref:Outer membrane protein beta-barrel domain-containing protein n=1 Tax=Flavobacterium okayamense TaxID=2830782 RepID=A0ABM7S2Y9_9FLAO|nr:hypothetical protein [Flavobacterium okayamense]BCY27890.1 hypothetical protein KK2020170_07580 [Flavobacterium okayamense]
MKENKKIERLFQEKFKDFEAMPPIDAWENIEKRLQNKKNKRRVIPFWLKSSGIAAVLIVSIGLLFNKNINKNQNTLEFNNDNSVVIQDNHIEENKTNSINSESNSSEFVKEANPEGNTTTIIRTNEVVTDNNTNSKIKELSSGNQKINSDDNLVFGSTNYKLIDKKANNKSNKFNENSTDLISNSKSEFVVAEGNKSSKNKKNNLDFRNTEVLIENEKNALSANVKTQESNNSIFEKLLEENNNNSIVLKSVEKLIPESTNSNIVVDNKSNQNNVDFALIDTLKIKEVLAVNAEETEDSNQVVSVETEKENELEKLLKEKEEGKNADEKEKEKRNRWVVSTNVAPVYFNSFSEGSPLDDEFESSDKSYQTSISYGVGAEYNLSKKFSLRSGLNTFNLSYNVNDVVFYQDVNAKQLKNVETNEAGRMISVQSEAKNDIDAVTLSGDIVSKYNGELNQQLKYIEVPLELSYKVVDSKFGINVIGGMSTLFLQDNSVSLKSNGIEMEIGEAKNLNNVHFSGNVGLGFRYTFWKSFNANFQPMLKYQFNTFSESSGNFKPYIVGLYTGLSFNF